MGSRSTAGPSPTAVQGRGHRHHHPARWAICRIEDALPRPPFSSAPTWCRRDLEQRSSRVRRDDQRERSPTLPHGALQAWSPCLGRCMDGPNTHGSATYDVIPSGASDLCAPTSQAVPPIADSGVALDYSVELDDQLRSADRPPAASHACHPDLRGLLGRGNGPSCWTRPGRSLWGSPIEGTYDLCFGAQFLNVIARPVPAHESSSCRS